MQEYGQEYGDEGFIQILKERLETAWNRDITQGPDSGNRTGI